MSAISSPRQRSLKGDPSVTSDEEHRVETTLQQTSSRPSGRRHFNFWNWWHGIKDDDGTGKFQRRASGLVAKNYDYLAERPPGKRTNLLESIAHLIKSCLGGGLVGIHEAYMYCGLFTALVLNVFLGFLVAYLMYVLAKSAQLCYGRCRVPIMSYPDLAEATLKICRFKCLRKCAKCFRIMVDVTIIIDLFGSCCTYQVIIARTLRQLMIEWECSHEFAINHEIRIFIAMLLLPCILICMIRSLKFLAPFSIAANVVIVAVAVATVVYGIKASSTHISEFKAFKDIEGLTEFIGVCVFSMEGVGVTLPIENNMKQPKKMGLVILVGMFFVVGIVMLVGFFGYFGFGEAALAPVTLNFPMDIVGQILKAALAFMIYVTFALNFWIPFELLWYYVQKCHNPDRFWLTERFYRAIMVCVVTGIAIAFPEVSKLMGVIGSFCLSNMGFIYPAFIELLLVWDDPGLGCCKWRFFKFLIFLFFGLFLMIWGTFSNTRALIKSVYYK